MCENPNPVLDGRRRPLYVMFSLEVSSWSSQACLGSCRLVGRLGQSSFGWCSLSLYASFFCASLVLADEAGAFGRDSEC
jgi:hypothetical protein